MNYTGKKMTTFKERFSDLCAGSTKTDSEIAAALKVSKQTISAWKIGTRSPKEPTIISIASYFYVRVDWLMGFDVEKYESAAVGSLRERILEGFEHLTPENQARMDDYLRLLLASQEDGKGSQQ